MILLPFFYNTSAQLNLFGNSLHPIQWASYVLRLRALKILITLLCIHVGKQQSTQIPLRLSLIKISPRFRYRCAIMYILDRLLSSPVKGG